MNWHVTFSHRVVVIKKIFKKMFRLLLSRVHQLGTLSFFNIKTFFPQKKKPDLLISWVHAAAL
jgi:hypothetical protein